MVILTIKYNFQPVLVKDKWIIKGKEDGQKAVA